MFTQVGIATGMMALLTASALASTDPASRGLEIARQVDRANEGFEGERAKLTLELINAHGDALKRTLALEVMEVSGDGDRSRSVFDWPADVKGTKLLTWTHKSDDDDQWLYLPAVKRIKRISSSNKSGSFMGSEFAYEDLAAQELEKYTYKFVDEPKLAGRDTWRFERYPVSRNSGYARQVVWMDKQYMNPLRTEYFDRKNELLKVATFEKYQRFGKYWRWGVIRMDNVQTKKRSVLSWDNRELPVKLTADRFDSVRLED